MTISRGKRVLGAIVNSITFFGLGIGNLFLLLTAGKTVGGLVADYKYEKGGMALLKLAIMKMAVMALYGITLGIFFVYDIVTMEKRDGTFAESWADNRKVAK